MRLDGSTIALVQNLLNAATIALDQGDAQRYASCFSPNGSLYLEATKEYRRGHEELINWVDTAQEKRGNRQHWLGNICVEVGSEGTLSSESYWQAWDQGECVSSGVCRDVVVRDQSGCWMLDSRTIVNSWAKS